MPPHAPEQNGVAERRHRHIVETGLSLLHYARLPLNFWSHAFQTAVYLINRLPTTILNSKSPYQILYGCSPTYAKLKPFGCLCYPWLRPYSMSKLQPRSSRCLFLGYSPSKSAYKCLDLTSHKLYHSRHVQFVEDQFPYHCSTPNSFSLPSAATFLFSSPSPSPNTSPPPPPSSPTILPISVPVPPPISLHLPSSTSPTPNPSLTDQQICDQQQNHDQQPSDQHTAAPTAPILTYSRRPKTTAPSQTLPTSRPRKPNPKYFNDKYVNFTTLHPIPNTVEPSTPSQALKDPKWRKAMEDEFNALLHNHTWDLVPLSSQKPIGCKWVYRVKRNPDGSIAKYKARLVAKGFHQEYGKDYFDTFSPVTKPVTIRTVLSIALSKHWPIRQLDVNNAFLHGTLHEEVFMVQPPGYVNPQFPNHICKLRKSLYGLKQAPRAWYIELTNFLLGFGFRKSFADPSLFIYQRDHIISYFLVYVDDIVLTGNNTTFLHHFIDTLSTRFSIKDLGSLHHFLGIEVIPTPTGLFLSQHRHILDLLTQFHMDGAKEVITPLSSSVTLTPSDGSPPADPTQYRKLVGSLQYLAFTRPDVSFAVNKLSQFMHSPSQLHWQALKRVLRYLKGTVHYGLFLNRHSSLDLTAFSDSDWGGVSNGGRSTTAYILYLGSNIISWRSSRQKSVSRSSTEAEYKALANAAAEISWVQNLLKDLAIPIPQVPRLFCDNTGATYLCANPVYHSRMKHIALDYHFVRERVSAGTLKVHHVHSADQLADVLTKPLPRAPFLRIRSKIGVSDGSSILRGRIKETLK